MRQPDIPKKNRPFLLRPCARCSQDRGSEEYTKTKSIFYKDGYLPICNSCIKEMLIDNEYSWDFLDKLCQYAGIPFIPKEWERIYEMNGENAFPIYAQIFLQAEYDNFSWQDYHDRFKTLKEQGVLEKELPLLDENRIKELKEKWGFNYTDPEDLNYLENFYTGIVKTQNVDSAIQYDNAKKLCKIALIIDEKIRGGDEFDKPLASYDKLMKVSDFTPKNTKGSGDIESVGELFKYQEQRGWVNPFYDRVTRDIVDQTVMNIENFNQRLYTNEAGIGEDIERRIEALKSAQELENIYDVNNEYDLDEFQKELDTDLNEEFIADIENGDDSHE